MKRLIPPFFLLFLSFQILAQDDLLVIPNPYIDTFRVDLSDNDAQAKTHGFFVNISDETLSVKWQLALNGAGCPSEWEYQICDSNQCYIWGVHTNAPPVDNPVILEPGDSSLLDLYFRPNGVAGCCTPTIFLSHYDDPTNIIATAEFDICIENITAVMEQERANLRVFPNPTTSHISLSENDFVKSIWVSNILGRRVKTFPVSYSNQYDLSDLPSGIYLVSMVDKDNVILKTVRINKYALRP